MDSLRARIAATLRLLREAGAVALGSMAAAAAVLFRDIAISDNLGRTAVADTLLAGLIVATTVGQLVPTTFQTSVFSSAVHTKVTKGPRAMHELLGTLSLRFVALAVVLMLVMFLANEPLARLIAPRASTAALALVLPILAFFTAALAINELGKSIFALEKRYVSFAIAGGVGNLLFGGLVMLRSPHGATDAAELAVISFATAAALTWTAVLGAGLVRLGGPARDRALLRRTYAQALPSLGAGTLTIGMSVVDQIYTMPLGEGSYATLAFAQRWPMFATQLPALALGTVLLRTMAEDALQLDPAALRAKVRHTVITGLGVGVLACLGGLVIGPLLVRATLQRGSFTAADAESVISVQRLLFVQAPFVIGGIVYLRVLNALRLNHVGFVIGAMLLALNGTLNWLFTRVWHLGVHGIALSTVCIYVFSGACLALAAEYALRGRIRDHAAAPPPERPD
ncbi:MAG: hypothetical protein IPL61_25000 [Myxococcales bacterium]|nr:hypothetical protein [Myxococcales bacterium]